ncbi:hypothetical protein PG984_015486 [Apiospora sp. TS-2023a]
MQILHQPNKKPIILGRVQRNIDQMASDWTKRKYMLLSFCNCTIPQHQAVIHDSAGPNVVQMDPPRIMSIKDGIELLKTETVMLSQEVRAVRRSIDLVVERYFETLPAGTSDALFHAMDLLTDVTHHNDLMQERIYAREQDYLEGLFDPWDDYEENLRHRMAVTKVDIWATRLVTKQNTKELAAFRTAQTVGASTISVGIVLLILAAWKVSKMVMAWMENSQ